MAEKMTVQDHEKQVEAARGALCQMEAEKSRHLAVLQDRLDKQYEPLLAYLKAKCEMAEADLNAAMVAQEKESPSFPLPVGTVVKWEEFSGSWSRKSITMRGVIELCTPETQFASNAKYGLPKVGKYFIRILGKDGKVGKRFKTINPWNSWLRTGDADLDTAFVKWKKERR